MTERTLKVSLTSDEIEIMLASMRDSRRAISKEAAMAKEALLRKLMPVNDMLHLMKDATKLYEDDRIALFEHPVHGDEVPLMCYWKDREFFDENTGFYDVADVEEIVESYRSAFKKDFS